MIKNIKFKIALLSFLSLWIFTPTAFATEDIKITIAVQSSEKDVKVTILNNTDDPLYKITTTLSNSIGFNIIKSGTFDSIGGTIVQSFADLTTKSDYSLTVKGERVSAGSKVGTITKGYSFITNFVKPGIKETSNTTTPSPDPSPAPVEPDPKTPQTTNPNPTAGTIAGAGLTQEQIKADKAGNGLVPCKDTCDFNDVMQLINNLITFLIVTLFIPIIVLLFMYAGYQYLTAEGNPSKIANLKKMVWHIITGMLLVLCSWLIVKTILTIISSDEVGVTQFLK